MLVVARTLVNTDDPRFLYIICLIDTYNFRYKQFVSGAPIENIGVPPNPNNPFLVQNPTFAGRGLG